MSQPGPSAPAPLPAPAPAPSAPATWILRVVGLHRSEVLPAGLAAVLTFTLFVGYSLMKPLRDAANAALADRFGERATATAATATLVGMALAALVVGWLVSLLGWKRFWLAAHVIWMIGACAFGAAFTFAGTLATAWPLAGGFIVCVSVFNLLSLSLVWSRLGDLFTPERAKRVYPLIGLGITLGNIAGSATMAAYARALPPGTWLFISAAALLAAMGVATLLVRCPDRPDAGPGGGTLTGGIAGALAAAAHALRAVASSPYLAGIAVYLLLYSTTGTILWFEQQRIVRAAHVSAEDRTAAFAAIDLYTNIATLGLQGLAAGRVVGLVGVGIALTVTPLTTAIGIGVLYAWPSLAALVWVQVGRRALHYAIDRPAREALYTVLGPDDRRKAKGFIDTFIYRLGDQCGAWLQVALGALTPAAVGGAVAACVVWGGLGLGLGRGFGGRSAQRVSRPSAGLPS